MVIYLADDRVVWFPIQMFPSIENGSKEQWENFERIGNGIKIHWPELDMDMVVPQAVAGNFSLI